MTRLEIRSLGRHGEGVAEHEGRAVYVPYALPGEIVEADVAGNRATIIDRIEASAERIEAFCPHFGTCGGCQLQHWQGERYREWKRDLVVTALRHRGIAAEVEPLIDAHGAGRRRATLHVRRQADGIIAGFNAARSHDVHAIDLCPILEPALAGAPVIAHAIGEIVGDCDVLFTACDNGIDVNVEAKRRPSPLALAPLAEKIGLLRLSVSGEPVVTRTVPLIAMGSTQVTPPPAGFLQATHKGEETLAALVLAALGRGRNCLDLFCGVGPFALRIAERAAVHAADSDAAALAALDAAARHAKGLKPIRTAKRDLFREPFTLAELKPFDTVIFDPPRAGAEAQSRHLAKSKIPLIVAVACDPASFARDASILIGGGYRLEKVTPVDQFAFTAHVEMVGVFRQ
jgi:23S rRNA (uracil1939-C5)-methyltransferase